MAKSSGVRYITSMSDKQPSHSTWKFNLSPLAREFQVFRAIYEAGSLSKASEKLDLDQGNISKTLKNLENHMELKLFVRHRSGVIPTPDAQALERALKEVSSIWEAAKKGAYNGKTAQTLRIGAHKTIAQSYFPAVFETLQLKRPDAYLEIEFDTSYEITRKVMARKLDLGVVVNPIKSQDMIIKPLSKERIELCGQDPDQEDITLIRNPQMVYIEKLLKNAEFRKVIDVQDYDVAAAICEREPHFWAVLPSTVRERHASLKVLRSLKNEVDVKLITYPGSPVAGILAQIRKNIRLSSQL